MDSPIGLLVPNIKNCQALSVFEIALEMNRLIELGTQGKLGTNDLSDCTFTLSNIGTVSYIILQKKHDVFHFCLEDIFEKHFSELSIFTIKIWMLTV